MSPIFSLIKKKIEQFKKIELLYKFFTAFLNPELYISFVNNFKKKKAATEM